MMFVASLALAAAAATTLGALGAALSPATSTFLRIAAEAGEERMAALTSPSVALRRAHRLARSEAVEGPWNARLGWAMRTVRAECDQLRSALAAA